MSWDLPDPDFSFGLPPRASGLLPICPCPRWVTLGAVVVGLQSLPAASAGAPRGGPPCEGPPPSLSFPAPEGQRAQ